MKNDYTVPQKEWAQRTRTQLETLEAALAKAELRLAEIVSGTDKRLRSRTVAARAKLDHWRSRFDKARETPSERWNEAGSEVVAAWEDSRAALEAAIWDIEKALDGDSPDAPRPQEGDTVHVHYRGRLSDGSEFQSTLGREPLDFVLGEGQVVPGVEEAVSQMSLGEKKSVQVSVNKAFGPRDESLVLTVDRDALAGEELPRLGDRATLRRKNGKPLLVTVRRIENEIIQVDANHPLAGHELHMDLALVGIS